ncbi:MULTISPECIES: sugar ABC transporter substrate-binding protein [unclassified Rhodococcus (in: high G+C Gram-positive bacteria)]|uniref:sugar ABC transporter substrate-binding protein n=1 Tax=unclassified Rhodococcus (in: high G+C Gram-positive bacteria) TaxID=192944 RepID=UPI0006F80B37|nr:MULTISPECIES: sugar ABC transporter substrate-binding protein [unclassified Rhodococcus (in: high G+C Gram-positive bacteria)]KQU28441.1 hypothetical protein ASG69_10550 [Rhodococcus sp. Leaf225]KQU47680.1 hypothetical protein ASH03_21510 [Rhodococcus sp. Leaf258]
MAFSIRTLDDRSQSLQAILLDEQAEQQDVNLLPVINANGDPAKQNQDIGIALGRGVGGLIVNPLDGAAIVPAVEQANVDDVPVVTIDSSAAGGNVAMAVQADNLALGAQACDAIGQALNGRGSVLNLQGDLAGNVGVERSEGFTDCIKKEFPGISVVSKQMEWSTEKCAEVAQTVLSTTQIDAIYSASEIICLNPVAKVLRSLNRSAPVGSPGHVPFVAIDGSSEGLQAVREGVLDGLISQPRDRYAEAAVYWVDRAMQKLPIEAGSTPHGSSVVVSEDGQYIDNIPAPMVTRDNVDDSSLWGNK